MEAANTQREMFQKLLTILDELPYRDKEKLEYFRREMDLFIIQNQGPDSPHLRALRAVRFIPASFYSSEQDYRESWDGGIEFYRKVLNIIGHELKLTFPEKIKEEKSGDTDLLALLVNCGSPIHSVNVIEEHPHPQDGQSPGVPAREASEPDDEGDEADLDELAEWLLPHFKNNKDASELKEPPTQPAKQEAPQPAREVTPVQDAKPLFEPVAEPFEEPVKKTIPDSIAEGQILLPDFLPTNEPLPVQPKTNQLFVVHGYDTPMCDAAIFALEKLGFQPILSYEKDNANKTVVQKAMDYPHISFAVVLLSADDLVQQKEQPANLARLRTRQKVVFELGFLVGKFGRSRVFVLYPEERNFELPTTFFDALYTPYDTQGRWQFDLIKALRACGFTIDANKLV